MEHIINRVKSILLSPKEALAGVKTEEMPLADTMKQYVAILAAIPPVSYFIGHALIGLPLIGRLSFGRSLLYAIVSYVIQLLLVIIFAKVIDALAQNFGGVKSEANSFKLAVFSFTPIWVAGVFYLIPALSALVFLGSLYGIYILYLGLPTLMESPKEKTVAYTVVSLVIMLLLSVILYAIISAIVWGGTGGPTRYF